MNKKRVSIIFIIISIVFLLTLIGIYGYRLIHYYRLEHPKKVVEETKNLSQTITTADHIVTTGDGLYEENKKYYFKGNVTNNYLFYSGNLFRILGVNEDNTINLITEKTVTSMIWGYEQESFKDSYIQSWLNNEYYKTLKNIDQYIVEKERCVDAITNTEKITCEQKEAFKVGLLSITDYQKALGGKSYLNTSENYWLSNYYQDGETWYVTNKGTIASKDFQGLGVRPVITIKGDLPIVSGDGTLENPYVIEADTGTTLGEKEIGKYVSFSDQTWRIIEQDEGTKIVLNGYITDEEDIISSFSNKNSMFNPKQRNTLAYYLNTTYLKTLNQDKMMEATWEVGTYGESNHYDYQSLKEETITAYVGLLKVADLFINDYSDYFLLTPKDETSTIYSVKPESKLYEDSINTELKIRPVVALHPDLTIISGTGTSDDPYVLE